MKKERLDKVLVERGLVESRQKAQALILAGKVRVNAEVVTKAGHAIAADATLTVAEPEHPYVSRGGVKLAHALDHYGLDPKDKVALDVGASTGGFTDVLLQRGARRVYAIDVGTNQLDWKLRADPRVVSLEQQNIRHFDPALLPEPCDLGVIDVSFISLTLVLPPVATLLGPGKPVIALIKPQFEVGKGRVGKGGIVRDETDRLDAVNKIQTFAADQGFAISEPIPSPITGTTGNVEFLILVHTPRRH